MRVLTLPICGKYFDQIHEGTKKLEYRQRTDFWKRRIAGRQYDAVVLTRGYPKGGGVEGVTRLTRQWRGHLCLTITHPHFGDEPVDVYAIDVAHPVRLSHTEGER